MNDPIHIISLGAGVQSSTMALMAAKGEITPMPQCAIFADTQAEPKSVYTWLDWLEKQIPFPVIRVSSGNLAEWSTTIRERADGRGYWSKNGIPAYILNPDGSKGILMRQCTHDFKILPILKKIREIAAIKRAQKIAGAISWIGISRDESSRMKASRHQWVTHRWPLVDLGMRRFDCLKWMSDNSYPCPPRSACIFCPYHSDKEWKRLKEEEPEEFEKAVQFEKQLQEVKRKTERMKGVPFLHSSMKLLSEVDFSTEEERGQINMFNNECEGMCGV